MSNFRKMMGATYLYNAREVKVQRIEHVEDDLYDVKPETGKTFRVNAATLKKEFLPVSDRKGESVALVRAMNENLPMKNLGQTLSETLDKLKSDPKYIDQARAINETAKTMIELGKLQVEIVRTARGL